METVYSSGVMQGGIVDALLVHPYWYFFLIAILAAAGVICFLRCAGLIKSCPLWPMPFLKGPASARNPRIDPSA